MLAEKRLLPELIQEELNQSFQTLNQTQPKLKTTSKASTITKRKTKRKIPTKKKT